MAWPDGTDLDRSGRLRLRGHDATELADRWGTPLYVYDAGTVRAAYREFTSAFREFRPVLVSYSLKACAIAGVAGILARAGAGGSAASLGEALAARRAGFPAARIQVHGNAKTDQEIRGALRAEVGVIVVDSSDEIERLARLTRPALLRHGRRQDVWLRVNPDIGVDTHPALRTAMIDSKFGATIGTGDALAQIRAIAAVPGLRLTGIHAHIGTEVHEVDRYGELAASLVAFAHEVQQACGIRLSEIGVGGGVSVRDISLVDYAAAVSRPIRADSLTARATITVEPGRWLVNRAGVALYRVISRKVVPNVRTFVAVDGGMGDNIRPALYGSQYSAVIASRPAAPPAEKVAIAGKYCEGGDLLVKEIALPEARVGEVLAVPGSGAYALAMASNYNHMPRPAVALLEGRAARLIRRRETAADIWRLES